MGFMPEAFINMLALLGWNDGSGEELFDLATLANRFEIERIHKGGAKFDFEKAKWFNQEWIKKSDNEKLLPYVVALLSSANVNPSENEITDIISMVKERCQLLNDFLPQMLYFFQDPSIIDTEAIRAKWDENKSSFFASWSALLEVLTEWNAIEIENSFKSHTAAAGIKPGELQLPFRIMLVGGKFGPPVFEIASKIGKTSTLRRISHVLKML
jgi:glutamyl-tRNA synthetase